MSHNGVFIAIIPIFRLAPLGFRIIAINYAERIIRHTEKKVTKKIIENIT